MKKNKLYKLLFLMCLAVFTLTNVAMAQGNGTKVTGTIVNEQGEPVSGVNIYGPKGTQATTDANGKFVIVSPGEKSVAIEKEGFESKIVFMADLTKNIILTESEFLASEKDLVKLGIGTKYRRDMVGSVSTITPKDHMTYDNTQWVGDYINGMLLGVRGGSNIRGLGNALFVIDGVIGRDPNILNMDEVDQITVLKDANAVALYGSQARNGVIVINTKRGDVNERKAIVNVRYGVKQPIALPNYLNSADYLTLFNEALINDEIRKGGSEETATGLTSAEDIENYRSGNPIRYPDVDLYSGEYLRSHTSTADITTQFSGGDEKTQYYVNMGWKYDQSLVQLNPEANAGANRFNVRGNIDFKVNDWISSSVDAVAVVNTNKSGSSNLLSNATSFKPNEYAPLIPVSMIDTEGSEELANLVAGAQTYNGFLLGTTNKYKEDGALVANILAGGYKKSNYRSTQFNNSINFDLDMITEGLTAKTYLSFDFYDAYTISINNKYAAYEVPEDGWQETETETGTITSINKLTKYGVDLKDQEEGVSTNGFTSRVGFYGLLNYTKAINENHAVNSTFLAYYNSMKSNNDKQVDKSAHLGLQVSYDYKKKIFADFSAAYVHSIKLPDGNRGGLAPTFGLGYIISEEGFMSNLSFIDYLKLKVTGGVTKTDMGINDYFLYDDNYRYGSSFGWADGSLSLRSQELNQGANYKLGYEERVDLNVGFETLLDKSVWLEFNYFQTDRDKQVSKLYNQYPSYYSAFIPYGNFNKTRFTGFELGMNYGKKFNDFTVNVGGNIMYAESEVLKRDEIYAEDYLYRAGKPGNAIFGLVDDGFYTVDDFMTDESGNLIYENSKAVLKENMPIPQNAVIPGDIKYVDQNDDGVIDNNDQKHIGESGNPWSYGVNFKVNYKGFSLFVLGTGQFGGQATLSNNYYKVDGNDKYSEYVLNRWTPETANTATYPRLSASKDNHNLNGSTFWMYNNSYFRIQRAQLTYEFNKNFCEKIKMRNLSVNFTGFNLLQIATNKDIRELNIGAGPQNRTFMLGLRTSF